MIGKAALVTVDTAAPRHRTKTPERAMSGFLVTPGKAIDIMTWTALSAVCRSPSCSADEREAPALVEIRAHFWRRRIHWVCALVPSCPSGLRRRSDGRPAPAGARRTAGPRSAALGAAAYRARHPCPRPGVRV